MRNEVICFRLLRGLHEKQFGPHLHPSLESLGQRLEIEDVHVGNERQIDH